MIDYRTGDLLAMADLTHLLHQCNLYHTFGSGLALQIKKKYPAAYEADRKTVFGDRRKLGGFSFIPGPPAIFNLYSQKGLGGQDRQTSYDALDVGLRLVDTYLRENLAHRVADRPILGVPYKLGSGLANGAWPIVEAILNDVFTDAPYNVLICRRPGD